MVEPDFAQRLPHVDQQRHLDAVVWTDSKQAVPNDAARWTAAPGGPAFYAYSTNFVIDLEAGIILDVEATSAHRTEEVNATRTMMHRVEEKFDLKPRRLVADTAYGTGPLLDWVVTEKQMPHIPA